MPSRNRPNEREPPHCSDFSTANSKPSAERRCYGFYHEYLHFITDSGCHLFHRDWSTHNAELCVDLILPTYITLTHNVNAFFVRA